MQPSEFIKLSKQTKDPRKKVRILALAHFFEGKSRYQIAEYLKVSRTSVNKWVKDYLDYGLEGLEDLPRSGRPCKLGGAQLKQLKAYVLDSIDRTEGGRLTLEDIQQYISESFHIEYELSAVHRLLKRQNFSWISSRSIHPKGNQAHQEAFKNFELETILHTPGHLLPERIDVWFQDEARFGQQTSTTKVWAEKSSRPRVVKQQQFEYAYLFGAVCPTTGETEALISPIVNKEVMYSHLEQISQRTQPGRMAVVVMDRAAWHFKDGLVKGLENVVIIRLPPYSPELNPIEQVWSWLRQHKLSNRTFANYDGILDQVSEAWNAFISCADRVKSLCFRDWINLTS
ncbi:IS630 family transposase [Pseudoalteromonas sp. R3]|uniref:IS630 family transposase n=2 Tax=Pseudoalteromonas sp. R3 TaxID=1709477 RepID=UPI000FDD017F|nr:IS630 family transposase [Pseudoalteromonas sp. R3]AZZ99776.1 IS630 family transposase [Pseudoalteromonas sp. R3]